MLKTVSRDSLARNSILIMSSTVATSGLGYLFWLVAARALPPPAVGAATALISAATVVSMLSNLGIHHMFIQRLPGCAPAAWSRAVSGGLVLGCSSTALAGVLMVAVAPVLSGNFGFLRSATGTVELLAAAVALTASTLLDYVFVAHRASHGMLWRNLALAAGKVLILVALTMAGLHGSAAVLLAWIVPSALVTAYTLKAQVSRLKPGIRLGLGGIAGELRHIRGALTGHHLINLAQAGPSALLPVLVTARLGEAANAHFYVAWMTASVLFMVSPAVASAFYAERSNSSRAAASLPKAAVVVMGVIAPPALILFFGGGLVLGLFSSGYATGETLLKILVLAAVPDAVTNLAVAHWRSLGLFRRCLHLNILMATVCLALTWLWLPAHGIVAAGFAWIAGQSVGALAVFVQAAKPHRVIAVRRQIPSPAPARRRDEVSVR